LEPTGATSPGASCREIEWAYQGAIRDAVREVRGLPIAWYFLHVDDRSPVVLPRIMSLDAARGEACVTMVSAGNDASWQTQQGEPSTIDDLITADGQSGRLVELYRNGSVIGFHTHWQSLCSEVRTVRSGQQELRRLPDGSPTLEPSTWRQDRGEIAWCADLPAGELTVSLS